MSASVAKARARPTRCCMPPDSSWANLPAHWSRCDQRQLLLDDAVALGLGHAAQLEPERRRSRRRCATAAARTAGTPWRCGACAAWRSVSGVAGARRRPRCRRPRPGPCRATTLFSRLTARSSVDLPEPDSPISTQISPRSTASDAPATPSTCPVSAEDLVAGQAPVEQRQRRLRACRRRRCRHCRR